MASCMIYKRQSHLAALKEIGCRNNEKSVGHFRKGQKVRTSAFRSASIAFALIELWKT